MQKEGIMELVGYTNRQNTDLMVTGENLVGGGGG